MQMVSEATMQCEKSINNVLISEAKKSRPPKKEAWRSMFEQTPELKQIM